MKSQTAVEVAADLTLSRDGRSVIVRGTDRQFTMDVPSLSVLFQVWKDTRGLGGRLAMLKHIGRLLVAAGSSLTVVVRGRRILRLGVCRERIRLPLSPGGGVVLLPFTRQAR